MHPSFRLFATQNGARYANRHPLPLSIKGRFLEVQVGRGCEAFPVGCFACIQHLRH